ncbi:GNAT family N-acetyltransferase [Ktedonosporobacter rubrisoli]|uniref:GNAT family N-acetyltransferase n=1 Tax=Ktedonosporobacter rubrisoli TaxID=2509675 RepID=A0A4P6JPG7_KTERU|nr:GNAT family N-acetyltransferase [Ktedonosporobacter rubrisoli]QBD77279.1 GNAT family N-acetyltransferase [Ktedonosporobacter rubrisoli]
MDTQKNLSALTIQVFEQLDQIEARDWNGCCAAESAFSADYLQALARCELDCTFRYFVARKDGQVVGTSFGYLTRFPLFPLLHPRVFIGASPLTIGFPFGFSQSCSDQEILRTLIDGMIREASTQHAAMMVLRDVNKETLTTFKALEDTCRTLGFHRQPLFQQAWLHLRWVTFDDYLTALRARYRELVHRDLRRVQQAQCTLQVLPGSEARAFLPDLHRLWLQSYWKHQDPDQLLLPPAYFSQALTLPGCRVFLVQRLGHLLTFILTFEHASTLEAGHSGVDYALIGNIPAHRYAEYEIIRYAIDHCFERIDFGISHEANKQRLGCHLQGQYGYFCPLSPFARFLVGLHIDRWLLRKYGFAVAAPESQDGEIAPYVFRKPPELEERR